MSIETTEIGAAHHSIIRWLSEKTAELLAEIERQEFWAYLMSSSTDAEGVSRLMKEVYLDIASYQPHVIEAAIATIGQMPRDLNPRLVRSMLLHQAEEFDHGEMALRDYVGLGGSAATARAKRLGPEAFAVAGVWWMIARVSDPFAYLGALYLFEGLTPAVTAKVKGKLQSKGLSARSLEYIEFHSTEDVKHANLVHQLISDVACKHPESVESMKRGFEYFRAVYPLPVWRAAFGRSQASASKDVESRGVIGIAS